MFCSKLCVWKLHILALVGIVVAFLRVDADPVNITYVEGAVAKGAVCLDGSPPAYYLSRGFGSGVNSWIVNLEGGGWCNNVTSCLERKNTEFGSSKYMSKQVNFTAIISSNYSLNPDFYNWNKVKVPYCDGSSYTGDVEIVDPATKLNYRGARVWDAIMEDLLANGLDKAKNVLLAGNSAGGLACILHCDGFRALFPSETNVKCFSDASYFINEKDISGRDYVAALFDDVVTTHGSGRALPSLCTSKLPPGLCFFPQNVVKYIQTPLFILNAAYDAWQINNILVPSVADPDGAWHGCKINIKECSFSQLEIIQGFHKRFLSVLREIGTSNSRGLFINSCFAHIQSCSPDTWQSPNSPRLDNTTIANAVGDWYYGRRKFDNIDCPYPCDKTCVDLDYSQPN